LNNAINLRLNSTHYVMLYPQNGERIVPIDPVTSIRPMYTHHAVGDRMDKKALSQIDRVV